jgi:hypothetical protein
MTSYVALVRAVNVGGTGKLSMSDLKAMCHAIGFHAVRTYITSGNVVFRSAWSELEVKAALEARLQAYAAKPMGVAVPGGRGFLMPKRFACLSRPTRKPVASQPPVFGAELRVLFHRLGRDDNVLRFFANRAAKKWPLRGSLKQPAGSL